MDIASSIKKIARSIFKREMKSVHTQFPAQIISFDADKNTVSIQPCIKVVRPDDIGSGESELPVLEDIPVRFCGSGDVFLTCPVQKDSYGIYHVAEDDINQWLSEGGIVSASSVDRFNLDTGFFEPVAPWMFDSTFGAIATDRMSIRTRDGNTEVSVLANGSVVINTPSGDNINVNGGNVVVHGDSDAASLASKVDDYISALDEVFRKSWVVAPTDGGAALKAEYIAALAVPPTSTASSKIKVNG